MNQQQHFSDNEIGSTRDHKSLDRNIYININVEIVKKEKEK